MTIALTLRQGATSELIVADSGIVFIFCHIPQFMREMACGYCVDSSNQCNRKPELLVVQYAKEIIEYFDS
ncbi:hypothetical protein KIN20_035381 [Parelaphostrongylus tenuis]|uniref:Uncharacterized protein n=1 Tax=Parelaphostrongylus tenuis TaxID=148309 RepID=A0AAD5RB20_PARTN|nr:hypothetical protein KIN20_035381 [Parelaphostrongylus tenuis]